VTAGETDTVPVDTGAFGTINAEVFGIHPSTCTVTVGLVAVLLTWIPVSPNRTTLVPLAGAVLG
jgi:hypothetical protein